MATAEKVVVELEHAKKIMSYIGFKTVDNWTNEQFEKKLEDIVDLVEGMDPPDDEDTAASLLEVLAGIENGFEFEVIGDSEEVVVEEEEEEEESEPEPEPLQTAEELGIKKDSNVLHNDTEHTVFRISSNGFSLTLIDDDDNLSKNVACGDVALMSVDGVPIPNEVESEPKPKTKAKKEKEKKPKPQKPQGPENVRANAETRAYVAGQVLRNHGLKPGVTKELMAEVDAGFGKANDVQSKSTLINAWHTIRGYLSCEEEGEKSDAETIG